MDEKKKTRKTRLIDLTGQRFGRLLVLSRAENGSWGQPRWLCLCDCGTEITTRGATLRGGEVQSCHCLQRETMALASKGVITHGMYKTPTYRSWTNMKQRCSNPNIKKWALYGGRGIRVCAAWQDSFEAFYTDMGERPEGKTLDRINPDGNYEPANCRWATTAEQNGHLRKRRQAA